MQTWHEEASAQVWMDLEIIDRLYYGYGVRMLVCGGGCAMPHPLFSCRPLLSYLLVAPVVFYLKVGHYLFGCLILFILPCSFRHTHTHVVTV